MHRPSALRQLRTTGSRYQPEPPTLNSSLTIPRFHHLVVQQTILSYQHNRECFASSAIQTIPLITSIKIKFILLTRLPASVQRYLRNPTERDGLEGRLDTSRQPIKPCREVCTAPFTTTSEHKRSTHSDLFLFLLVLIAFG